MKILETDYYWDWFDVQLEDKNFYLMLYNLENDVLYRQINSERHLNKILMKTRSSVFNISSYKNLKP